MYRSVGGEVTQDGDFLLFEGNRYDRRGFLYKNFVMSAIVSDSFIISRASVRGMADYVLGSVCVSFCLSVCLSVSVGV